MKFEVGDVVILRGLANFPMVIEDWNYENSQINMYKYTCIWFDKNDVLHREIFSEKLLIKID